MKTISLQTALDNFVNRLLETLAVVQQALSFITRLRDSTFASVMGNSYLLVQSDLRFEYPRMPDSYWAK